MSNRLQTYFQLRYELDQILPDATIQMYRGRGIKPPYERWIVTVDYNWVTKYFDKIRLRVGEE